MKSQVQEKCTDTRDTIIAIIVYISVVIVGFWSMHGFAYWTDNPELTQMQVFKHMIGL